MMRVPHAPARALSLFSSLNVPIHRFYVFLFFVNLLLTASEIAIAIVPRSNPMAIREPSRTLYASSLFSTFLVLPISSQLYS